LKLPRLREVREIRGLSQGALAEKADVSRDSISNYETGHREAYPSTARKLANALGVSVEELERSPNWRAHYLKQEAEHLDGLGEALASARDALNRDRADYAARFLELVDDGIRAAAESLHEAHRIETGKKRTVTEKSLDDQLSELMREWQAEKA
jgi:transcriptional regulator with XRE-family HTH domain